MVLGVQILKHCHYKDVLPILVQLTFSVVLFEGSKR